MNDFVNSIREQYGETISYDDFESIYEDYSDLCVEKYGKPELNFVSVVGFGNRCRAELKELLNTNNITIV